MCASRGPTGCCRLLPLLHGCPSCRWQGPHLHFSANLPLALQGDCSSEDPYFDYPGSLRCLMEGAGEARTHPHGPQHGQHEPEWQGLTADREGLPTPLPRARSNTHPQQPPLRICPAVLQATLRSPSTPLSWSTPAMAPSPRPGPPRARWGGRQAKQPAWPAGQADGMSLCSAGSPSSSRGGITCSQLQLIRLARLLLRHASSWVSELPAGTRARVAELPAGLLHAQGDLMLLCPTGGCASVDQFEVSFASAVPRSITWLCATTALRAMCTQRVVRTSGCCLPKPADNQPVLPGLRQRHAPSRPPDCASRAELQHRPFAGACG